MRAHDFPNHELSMRLTVLGMIPNGKCLKSKQNTVGVDYLITDIPIYQRLHLSSMVGIEHKGSTAGHTNCSILKWKFSPMLLYIGNM